MRRLRLKGSLVPAAWVVAAACIAALSSLTRGEPAATRTATSQPAAPAAVPTSPEIERLLEQARDDDWRVREKAQNRLAELAEAAEPRLRQFAAASDNAEARTRALTALARIAAARDLGPTPVTLHLKDAAARVFEELSRQGHIPVRPARAHVFKRADRPTVTLDAEREPFWVVLRRACGEFGLIAGFAGGDEEPVGIVINRDAGGEADRPAAVGGSFLVVVRSVEPEDDEPAAARPAAQPATRPAPPVEYDLRLNFFADPKWRVLQHPEETTLDAVADDQGKALPGQEAMRMQAYTPESLTWLMLGPVKGVPAGCRKLARLRGSFHIVLLEQSEPLEVPDILAVHNLMKKVAGRPVQVRELVKDGQGYKLRITFFRNGLSGQDWRQVRETQGVQLLDDHDRPLTRGGYNATDNGEQADYEISFFDAEAPAGSPRPNETPGKPAKLVVQFPLEPRELNVSFEFKDLPLGK